MPATSYQMKSSALLRLWAAFRRSSLLDRIAAAVLALYVLLDVLDLQHHFERLESFAGFLALVAAAYLAVRIVVLIRRHALWRLRNRLIVAYLFMAVVPVVLLLSMVGVSAYLLELQIGAHLLQDDLHNRLNILAADTNAIAAALNRVPHIGTREGVSPGTTPGTDPALAQPDVANVIAAAQTEWPDVRVQLMRGRSLVPPGGESQTVGFAEFRGQLWMSSLELLAAQDGQATVIVIAPVTPGLLDSFPSKLGPVRLTLLDPAPPGAAQTITFGNQAYVRRAVISSTQRKLAPASNLVDFQVDGVATFEALRVQESIEHGDRPVLAQFSLRPSVVNRDLLSSVGAVGPTLVEALVVIACVFLLIEIGALVTGVVMTRTITGSVAELYDATLHVRQGDFSHRIRVQRQDQLGALSESFNQMTGSISELIEAQQQKQRLEHEVEIAREVQEQLFPKRIPSVLGVELAAICRPARTVSGDYYDFLSFSPTRVGIAVADISGKGLYAALLMASVQAALHTAAALDGHRDTAELAALLNHHLFANTSEDRYATLFLATYDSNSRTLGYTNAGHLAPFLMCEGCLYRLEEGGTVVGLFESAEFVEKVMEVPPNSVLVAFSDGLTEIENVYGEEFGMERLQAEILKRRGMPAKRLAQELVDAAEQWAGSPDQADDITLVVARME